MTTESLEQILGMNGEERYDYFLNEVLEEREIWSLVNGDNHFLKLESEDEGVAYLPVWPSAVFAAAYGNDSDDLSPKSISLPDFFKKWVPGLTKDGLEIGVFPGADDTLWITEPEELKRDLQDEFYSRADALGRAAKSRDDAKIAETFSEVGGACIACHSVYLNLDVSKAKKSK